MPVSTRVVVVDGATVVDGMLCALDQVPQAVNVPRAPSNNVARKIKRLFMKEKLVIQTKLSGCT